MTSTAPEHEPRARAVRVTDDELVVEIADGRRIAVPLSWFPRLLHASPTKRDRWELLGNGEGIHWPDLDEDVSVSGLLRGVVAPDATDGTAAS